MAARLPHDLRRSTTNARLADGPSRRRPGRG